MATSGVYTFTRNRDQIITGALRLVGAVETGQPVYPEQINDTAEALNLLCKSLQIEGVGLWAITELTLPLTTTNTSYLIGPTGDLVTERPIDILEARRRDSSGNDVPLSVGNRDDYMMLSNKSNSGTVTQIYYQPTLNNGTLYVWPVSSNTTDTIMLSARIPFQDFTAMPDNADMPVELLRMLKWNLAAEIAVEFSVNPNKYKMIVDKAAELLAAAKFHDMEQSFSFAPDLSGR